ncbi:hypothetical protein M918_13795 [Clostridium sp. BL8]|uniref:SHOCT domain-containing protein n=1 Tax=Clostridium sp. BL8 TaxID=1354301 RepID=UPI00038A14CD|nr:SHOCT domain-containing protein [Clostridium sp. BL8]EQB86560.1 hypothetical protein M918_13795 [Clostridium sp. BL8]
MYIIKKNASIYKNIQNKIRKHMKDNLRLNSLEKNLAVYEIESGLITFYVWLCNNNLCLLDSEENGVGQYQIALDDIISFLREGDIYSETNIKGGDSSIGGAILGGVIAGDTGAIIGSRRKITTENIRKDFRFTILEYKDKDKKGHAIFNSEAYDAFLKLIPSKEIKFVATGNRIEVTEPKEDIFEQIEKLDKLMKKGIVTEEEFISKKADLLNKI